MNTTTNGIGGSGDKDSTPILEDGNCTTPQEEEEQEGDEQEECSPRKRIEYFTPKYGFLTEKARTEFLQQQVDAGRMGSTCFDDPQILSLEATKIGQVDDDGHDNDTYDDAAIEPSSSSVALENKIKDLSSKEQQVALRTRMQQHAPPPLFFWQIYNLTGREPILQLLTRFYDYVFDDGQYPEYEWFFHVFEMSSDKKYHINVQTLMYVDCFGGGRSYFGGESRLDIHHRETRAKFLMNERGAERWSYHMKRALDIEQVNFDKIDPRIRIAINTFLTFFVDKYGVMFDFDTSKIDFGDTYPPKQSTELGGEG